MKRRSVSIDMRVSQLTVDPLTRLPLLILEDETGEEALPIWIGAPEANAIRTELDQIELERPVAHDLLKRILGEVGVTVAFIEVDAVRNDTFYATIHLQREGGGTARERILRVDSRPSDAIALALRCRAPIRVRRSVLQRARRADLATPEPTAVEIGTTELLAALPDEEFGKWKM